MVWGLDWIKWRKWTKHSWAALCSDCGCHVITHFTLLLPQLEAILLQYLPSRDGLYSQTGSHNKSYFPQLSGYSAIVMSKVMQRIQSWTPCVSAPFSNLELFHEALSLRTSFGSWFLSNLHKIFLYSICTDSHSPGLFKHDVSRPSGKIHSH